MFDEAGEPPDLYKGEMQAACVQTVSSNSIQIMLAAHIFPSRPQTQVIIYDSVAEFAAFHCCFCFLVDDMNSAFSYEAQSRVFFCKPLL